MRFPDETISILPGQFIGNVLFPAKGTVGPIRNQKPAVRVFGGFGSGGQRNEKSTESSRISWRRTPAGTSSRTIDCAVMMKVPDVADVAADEPPP